MQIEHIEQKGIFKQAKVSSGQEQAAVEKKDSHVKKPDILTGSVPVMQTVTYQKPELEQEGLLEDIKNSAAQKNAVQMKNEMLVGAGTTSKQAAQEMEQDGFSLPDTDIHTVVTETDKIQMQLAKAGKDTGYFTGDLSEEQIAQIMGSSGLAAQYEHAFEQAAALRELDEGSIKYMMENGLEPTISNLYMAQYNGVYEQVAKPQDIPGQQGLTKQMEKVLASAGFEQTEEHLTACKWLAANDISVTAGHVGMYLALKDLSFPIDQNELFGAMQTAVLEDQTPADASLIAGTSLSERAETAMRVLDQTTDKDLSYVLGQGKELTIEHLQEAHHLIESGAFSEDVEKISASEWFSQSGLSLLEAQRLLEETRLAMTTEANYGLLKRGMEIEIKPLVELVEALKAQEQDYYKQLLTANGSEATAEQVNLFQHTIEIAAELKSLPAYALGNSLYDGTVQSLHAAGTQIQASQKAAGEAYEALMTAPRGDLGDSIQKAFRNVDDILREIGMEATESNSRAVRILAYNQLEISQQSVLQMKLADKEVQQAFDSLKPAVVREMIREGINPLHMQMSELNEQAKQIRAQIGGEDDLTKFSEYLWKLERRNDMTPAERDSFIGIYRLIHQVEAGDGAAIGALVEQGAPLTMGNLLRAVRSEKKSGMDYEVDDHFGGVEGTIKGASITDQINAAYQTQCVQEIQKIAKEPEQFYDLLSNDHWMDLTPEQLLQKMQEIPVNTEMEIAYKEEFLNDLREAAAAPETVYEMLEKYEVPATVNHVLAMQQMMANPNDALRRFFGLTDQIESAYEQYAQGQGTDDQKAELMSEIAEIKERLLHKLGEQIQTPEELAKAQETLAEVAAHCGQTVIREGMTRLDVRQFQMMSAQLHLCGEMVKEERYQIPILTSDGAVGVQLQIVRGEKKGSVRITMADSAYGNVAAEFRAEEQGIRGYLASDSREATDRLQRELPRVEELLHALTGEDAEHDVRVIFSEHLDLVHFELSGKKSREPENEAVRRMQTKELYGIAEKMILFFHEGLTKEAEGADIS